MVGHADGKGSGEPADGTTDEALAYYAATARTAEAVLARSRERWLRQQGTEQATLLGACWSAAEGGHEVKLRTVNGRSHAGTLHVVGEDFVSLLDRGREVLVPVAAVTTMSVSNGRVPAGRPPRRGATLAEALAYLAADRPSIKAWCIGVPESACGELVGASDDVALVVPAAAPTNGHHRMLYVRLASLAELSLMASG